jgi:NAD-dependent SIR2 family protein deacetylase
VKRTVYGVVRCRGCQREYRVRAFGRGPSSPATAVEAAALRRCPRCHERTLEPSIVYEESTVVHD